ncbi:dolichyl-phosphate-mannose-protein mannosyltransferase [Roseimicrobium gellanilyticum]|uniref:Dolichyl-phosphate-mannose-protein mannosyltransferase n=1 Tax=Roseimicrobium gellanilyticum TaxID=748857 RepID=A0A366HDJ0_9BACT|nr:glycosyltransferase family 39 protein [Roseimicrobium gellanilyticum]RBP40521.1 dolichyl-phosphate-mannose-protein mannosyltransferase [Roseimicrobium gellanilyticum]
MTDSAPPPARASLWQRQRGRFGTSGLVLLGVMLALLLGCVIYAAEGEKPWGRSVQRRIAKQEKLKPQEYAIIGTWWAAVVNAGVLALLLGTAGKWMPHPSSAASASRSLSLAKTESETPAQPPSSSSSQAPPDFARGKLRLLTFILLGVALVLGAWERWPRLHHSLWNDEEYAVRRFSHGAWEQQKDGVWKFEPVTWVDTLFESRNGNNHVANSLSMRWSLDAWRAITGAPREAFTEYVTRLPSYVASILTLLMIFLLGKELGSPLAGLVGAWLLALHPWHIRYAAEARGYAMMMCFLCLSLYGLLVALRTGQLRWWLLFAVGEALYLLSFPGALMVAAMVNLLALIELVRRRGWEKIGTLIAMNLLGAVIVLQLMLPNIPQILIFLKEPQPSYVTDVWQWYRDLGSVMVSGWPYENFFPDAHRGTDWLHEQGEYFFSPGVAPFMFLLLGGAALIVACVQSAGTRIVIVAPVLAGALTCLMNVRPGTPMTVWYLIFLLIPAVLALPLLMEEAARLVQWRWASTVLMVWVVFRFGTAAAHSRDLVRNVDRQPVRQTIALIREQAPNAMTGTFGVSDRQSAIYDPRVRILYNVADLDGIIADSKRTGLPLYLYHCSDQQIPQRVKDLYMRVTKSGEFDRIAELPGSEELFSYRVYRMK